MKTVKIYGREVMVRTGYRAYPYKAEQHFIVVFEGKKVSNCYETLDDKNLRIHFGLKLKTRSTIVVEDFVKKLGNKDDEKWLKKVLKEQVLKIE